MDGMEVSTKISDENVNDIVKKICLQTMQCTRLSCNMTDMKDYSDYPAVQEVLKGFRKSISDIIENVLNHLELRVKMSDDLNMEDKIDVLRECHDSILERINSSLDESQGLHKNTLADLPGPQVTAVSNQVSSQMGNGGATIPMVLLASRNVQKPQLFFQNKVDNSYKTPFVPNLSEKPHNRKPLSILPCVDSEGRQFYEHPYSFELDLFSPKESTVKSRIEPTQPASLDTKVTIVNTEDALFDLIKDLSKCKHVAIDVEHHAFRSYLGLTCLIQISSRNQDYIIDALELRDKLSPLNEITANPKIIKVLHGADHDVLWLQRDCGVYLVNMFDTHLAAVQLDFPLRSLAVLMQRFCEATANKEYQRADWRIRPLPADFIEYARRDTHFLLYIHDCLHNMLLEAANGQDNLLRTVYNQGTQLCLKRYEKPRVDETSYRELYLRSRKRFNNQQETALKELFLWRDGLAREHDESVDFVLPRQMLLQIAEVLPKEMQGILALCNPIPTLLKTDLLSVHNIIRKARSEPLIKVVKEIATTQVSLSTQTCLHDLSQLDTDGSLPCLLTDEKCERKGSQPLFGDMFNEKKVSLEMSESAAFFRKADQATYVKVNEKYLSPFERYMLYKDKKVPLPLLEEGKKSKKSKKGSNLEKDDRVSRIREYFLSLSSNTDSSSKATDSDRMARIFAEVKESVAAPQLTGDIAIKTEPGDSASLDSSSDDSSSSDSSSSSEDESSNSLNNDSTNVQIKEEPAEISDKIPENESSSSFSESSSDDSTENTEKASVEMPNSCSNSLEEGEISSSDEETEPVTNNKRKSNNQKRRKAKRKKVESDPIQPFDFNSVNYNEMFNRKTKKSGNNRGHRGRRGFSKK